MSHRWLSTSAHVTAQCILHATLSEHVPRAYDVTLPAASHFLIKETNITVLNLHDRVQQI